MPKIRIQKSPAADTRSASHAVTEEELRKSTRLHRSDVEKAMKWLAYLIGLAGERHDWTKVLYFNQFYDQFHKAQKTGEWGNGWYDQIHVVKERHHLKDRCPDDVDLVDVLEMLCDCVMAGLARTGEYREEEPDAEMLVKAYKNTVKKLAECVDVEENQDERDELP